MERVKRIMEHPLYQSNQRRIEELEQNRIFCKHGISHSLDVARIMYILVLEQRLELSKDVIYATALLHDIGRAVQYEEQISHQEAGAELAEKILKDCGYEDCVIEQISNAIASHTDRQIKIEHTDQDIFQSLLYKADKLSRECFNCKVQAECYWEDEKRNRIMKY